MNALKIIFIITILLHSTKSKASLIVDTLPSNGKIVLSQGQAIGTIKDLVSYDGLKEIVKIMEAQMIDLREILRQKDVLISSHEKTTQKYEQIIANDQVIFKAQDQKYNDLNRKYKNSVRWGRFKVVLLVGAIGYGIYQSIK